MSMKAMLEAMIVAVRTHRSWTRDKGAAIGWAGMVSVVVI
jgi:hypothetical protein